MALSALCVGEATVELIGAVPRVSPMHADRQELSAFALQGGGAAATAAATLSKLGAEVLFAGLIPDDFLGEFAAQGLADAGVDLRLLKRQQGGATPVGMILLEQDRGQRNVFCSRGEVERLRPHDVPAQVLEGISLLLVDGAFPEVQLALVEAARKKGVKTLLSAHQLAPGMAQLLAACEAVVASERFARELSALTPRSLTEILALGPEVAVVTLGEDGSVGQQKGDEPLRVEAMGGEAVDRTGAGDVYRGAFGLAWAEGLSVKDAMRFATAAAALKCRHYGAREGIPDRDAVKALLAA